MKRVGFLYDKICSYENIDTAITNASKNKKDKRSVQRVLNNREAAVSEIQNILVKRSFVPHPYSVFRYTDSIAKKERIIFRPKFYPDQIIHWAIIQVTQPIMMRGMYAFCCGSIPGRGKHYGKRYLEKHIRKDHKNTKYCLKMDITKFYPSIDKELLKEKFKRKIKDKDTLNIIFSIIDSTEEGLPIGNFTSQWWANFYLEDLDHFIKEKIGVVYYLRYVDDMVLLGRNKKELHKVRVEIFKFLENMGLRVKGDWQVFPIDKRAIDFLGFRFFRDRTALRKSNALRIRRRIVKSTKKLTMTPKDSRAILSYMGDVKHSDSDSYYAKHIKGKVNIGKLKKIVSDDDKRKNREGKEKQRRGVDESSRSGEAA